MPDFPHTKPDAPPADQTVEQGDSVPFASSSGPPTATETNPAFGPPEAADEVGTLGPYRVVKELGRGGMGAVYLAFDERLQRKVALKVMLPKYAAVASSKNRFIREARAAAGITHDHIVTVYEADERDGVPYMAMQFLQGYPLDDYLKQKGGRDLGEVLRIGRETALGLAAAHAIGLAHRDIKPANLWVEAPTGRIKILDFGLAKPTQDEAEDTNLTATGAVLGTPAFMAPEQARGEKADHRADLFSLGVVLYRLATGHAPFHGKTMMAMLTAVVADTPTPVREHNPAVPEALAQLIHQLLEKDPARRPTSAAAVAESIRQIETGAPVAALHAIPLDALPTQSRILAGADPFAAIDATEPGEVVHPPAVPPVRRPSSKWPLAALAALVVLLLGVAVFLPQILKVTTPKGTLVIETTDPDVEVTVKKGTVTIVEKSKQREILLAVGDDYTIDLAEAKDGLKLNTKRFEITKNGKATVTVTVEKPAVAAKNGAPVPDGDRKAAEYVIAVGGAVEVDGRAAVIRKRSDLPTGPFQLTAVNLEGNPRVTDAGLAPFNRCRTLVKLNLASTPVTDGGLVHFRECKRLETLNLRSVRCTDDGLEVFKDCRDLTDVIVSHTAVTDAGVKRFSACPNLESLDVYNTSTSDDALAEFKGCAKLTSLVLGGTRATDAGLLHFRDHPLKRLSIAAAGVTRAGLAGLKNVKQLEMLDLFGTAATDDWLALFKDCDKLSFLEASNTRVTEKGLAYLVGCKKLETLGLDNTPTTDGLIAQLQNFQNLRRLPLRKTKVTAAGVKDLHNVVPRCLILWDGGTADPIPDAFLEVHGAALPALTEWVAKLPPVYAPRWVATRTGGAAVVFDAVAVPAPVADARLATWSDADHAAYDELKKTHRLVAEAPYLVDGKYHTVDVGVADGGNYETWYGTLDHVAGKIEEGRKSTRVNDGVAERWLPLSLSAVRQPDGAFTYSVIQTWQADRAFEWRPALSPKELAAAVEEFRKKGWRPHLVNTVYGTADPIYLAAFIDNPAKEAWEFAPNLSAAEYEKQLTARAAKGERPRCVCSHEAGGAVTYTILWDGGAATPPKADAVPPAPKPFVDRLRAATGKLLAAKCAVHVAGKGSTSGYRKVARASDCGPDDRIETVWVPEGTPDRRPVADPAVLNALSTLPADGMLARAKLDLRCHVTPAELAALGEIPALRAVRTLEVVNQPKLDGLVAGLGAFPDLRHFQCYYGPALSDKAIAALPKAAPNLVEFTVRDTKITSAGLAPLAGLKLHVLGLEASPGVTDDAIEHLAKIGTLRKLYLEKSKVTADGAKKLAAALPKCLIQHTGGTIQPTEK